MKVKTYCINRGQKTQYFGLMNDRGRDGIFPPFITMNDLQKRLATINKQLASDVLSQTEKRKLTAEREKLGELVIDSIIKRLDKKAVYRTITED